MRLLSNQSHWAESVSHQSLGVPSVTGIPMRCTSLAFASRLATSHSTSDAQQTPHPSLSRLHCKLVDTALPRRHHIQTSPLLDTATYIRHGRASPAKCRFIRPKRRHRRGCHPHLPCRQRPLRLNDCLLCRLPSRYVRYTIPWRISSVLTSFRSCIENLQHNNLGTNYGIDHGMY